RSRRRLDGVSLQDRMTKRNPRIFISAGEPSGDLHGSALARALRERWPDAQLYGFGGDMMKAAGVELWAHTDQMAVMGFVELAENANHLAVVLPFEQKLFEQAGARVSFVGHPLLDLNRATKSREEFCAELGADPSRLLLAVLPGSRNQEVESHLELFAAAASL